MTLGNGSNQPLGEFHDVRQNKKQSGVQQKLQAIACYWLTAEKLKDKWAKIQSINDREEKLAAIDSMVLSDIRRRASLLRLVDGDRHIQKIINKACQASVVEWAINFCWTFDPRLKVMRERPFLLFPRQMEYLEWRKFIRDTEQNGLVEKTRDSGMSWLNMLDQVYCWLYQDGFAGGVGSNKYEQVETFGDPKSLFEKIRALVKSLPKWMVPKGFSWKIHSKGGFLENPQRKSSISGEGGDNMGRGGRTTLYDWDEVASTERPQLKESSLSQNTNTIIYTSTVRGYNFFYEKRKMLPEECIFTFDWRDDPRKDPVWYANQCEKFDEVVIASEIDRNYGDSDGNRLIPEEWLQAALKIEIGSRRSPPMRNSVDFNKRAGLDCADDPKGDPSVLTLADRGNVYEIQEFYCDTHKLANLVHPILKAEAISHLAYDGIGVGVGTGNDLRYKTDRKYGLYAFVASRRASDPSLAKRFRKGEEQEPKPTEVFANEKAEAAWNLRIRFENTYRAYIEGEPFEPEDLISLPNHPELIRQIRVQHYEYRAGRIALRDKKKVKQELKRSPDHFESLMICFSKAPAVVNDKIDKNWARYL